DRNGGLYVWEAATGYEFYTLKGHSLAVTDLDWRMDGIVLASCSEDGKVMLWEMNGGTMIKQWDAHPGGVQGVAFAPNGNIATVGRDKTAKIWKGDGTAIRTINASDDIVLSVAFSEDSKRLFTGDLLGNIKVWDVESGVELARIDPNPPPIEQQLAYAEKRITELNSQLPKLVKGAQAASAELTAARKGLAEVEKAIAAATQARDARQAELAKHDRAVKALAPNVEALKKDAEGKAAAAKRIAEALDAASKALKTQEAEATRLAQELAQKEAALQQAKQVADLAKAEATKPALSAEQQA